MAKLTPEEAALKQASRLKSSTEDIRRGIERVTSSPTLKAVAKQDKMKQKLVASIDNGAWAKGLKNVSLEDWKKAASEVGVNRIAAGIDAAQPKQTAFYAKLLPAVDAAKGKIAAMPDVTLDDSINRMTTYTREMAKFKK